MQGRLKNLISCRFSVAERPTLEASGWVVTHLSLDASCLGSAPGRSILKLDTGYLLRVRAVYTLADCVDELLRRQYSLARNHIQLIK